MAVAVTLVIRLTLWLGPKFAQSCKVTAGPGPTTDSVTELTLDDCDSVIPLTPAKMYCNPAPSNVPVVPAVLPSVDMPMLIGLKLAVMVEPFSPKLIWLEFENTKLPSPALFAPAENVTFPAAALGASKTIEPFVIATDIAPEPRKIKLLALVVPLDEPVVFPVPNIVICWLDCTLDAEAVMVEPFNPNVTLLEFEKMICEPVLVEPTAPKTTLP